MKLARLQLFGFKSFLHRATFYFNAGITSIVGPNGCGKSNVVDAIIWALGERGTKSLRVKEMGDVIFHGSNGKRPVNIAEVIIELTDGPKEFSVKRRIYRDGTNEYFLNNEIVRLKDVQDFFLGTGVGLNSYAIVEQGKIESFIQMKPQERRVIVEEASGITRFEEKKRDAMARLEEVRTNLERVEDIYGEVSKAFSKAEEERNRWKSYKVLADRLHEIERSILVDGHQKLSRKLLRIDEKYGELEKEGVRWGQESAKLKTELDMKAREFDLTDLTLRQLEVDLKAKEKDMETRVLEIGYVREEAKRLEEARVALNRTVAVNRERVEKTEEEIRDTGRKIIEAAGSLAIDEEKAAALQENLARLKEAMAGHEKGLEAERVRLFVAMSSLTSAKNAITETDRINKERARREEKRRLEHLSLCEKTDRLKASLVKLKETSRTEQEERDRLTATEAEAMKTRDGFSVALQDTKNSLERLKGEKRGREGFLTQMTPGKEEKETKLPGVKRLIDTVRVEEGREKALERFFFREMEYYVVPERETSRIAHVVSRHHGNYLFFPEKGLFRLHDQEVEVEVKWVQDLDEALERVSAGEEGIFANDDILVDSRGLILREKDARKLDLKQFRERRRLEKELQEIDGKIREHVALFENTRKAFNESDNTYRAVKGQIETRVRSLAVREREIMALEGELKATTERLTELTSPHDFMEETGLPPLSELQDRIIVHEAEKRLIEETMGNLRKELEEVRKAYEALQAQWHTITITIERSKNLIKGLGEESIRKQGWLTTMAEENTATFGKLKDIEERISGCGKKVVSLEAMHEALQKGLGKQVERYEELKKKAGDLHMERISLQQKIESVREETERLRIRMENNEKERAVLNEKRETIKERLQSLYHIDDPEVIVLPAHKSLDTEREDVAKEIAAMGEINFRAEKEYGELEERIAFLETQQEDLKSAVESLKKTIAKIDNLSKEIFLETFDTVNATFKRFAAGLFKGGTGSLILSPDTGGIEMYVQPPGKKTIRMELLSGGEKALMSLAFILALMDTRPSPFSIMDEIDAPLDDANLMSLLEIIGEISAKTQIVFITHNRITMESSQTIYGITMEEEGISKTVSVKL